MAKRKQDPEDLPDAPSTRKADESDSDEVRDLPRARAAMRLTLKLKLKLTHAGHGHGERRV
jgi:hypothetical protein